MKPPALKRQENELFPICKGKTIFSALALSELGSDKDLTNSVDELDIVAPFKKH